MGDASLRSSWGWEMPSYDPRKSVDTSRARPLSDDDEDDDEDVDEDAAALLDRVAASSISPNAVSRRLSLPILGAAPQPSYLSQRAVPSALASKLLKLHEQVLVSASPCAIAPHYSNSMDLHVLLGARVRYRLGLCCQ